MHFLLWKRKLARKLKSCAKQLITRTQMICCIPRVSHISTNQNSSRDRQYQRHQKSILPRKNQYLANNLLKRHQLQFKPSCSHNIPYNIFAPQVKIPRCRLSLLILRPKTIYEQIQIPSKIPNLSMSLICSKLARSSIKSQRKRRRKSKKVSLGKQSNE